MTKRREQLERRVRASIAELRDLGVPASETWDAMLEMLEEEAQAHGWNDGEVAQRAAMGFLLLQDVYGEEATRGLGMKRQRAEEV